MVIKSMDSKSVDKKGRLLALSMIAEFLLDELDRRLEPSFCLGTEVVTKFALNKFSILHSCENFSLAQRKVQC